MSAEHLELGARGWRHASWCGSYYPDDLPEDWQLSYYANEFRVVLVPADYWQWPNGYEVDEWIDAVDEGFRFYLEYPHLENLDEQRHFQAQCEVLGEFLGGVVVENGVELTAMGLSCPVVCPGKQDDELCIGLLDEGFEDLRGVRDWLTSFDEQNDCSSRRVFITGSGGESVPMEALMKVKTITEMMGL